PAMGGIEQIVRGVELGVTGNRADEEGLARPEIAVGVPLALAGRYEFQADRIAERLLEQDRADALVTPHQREGARVVGIVIYRAGEGIEREDLVPRLEIVLAERDTEKLFAGAGDAAH